MTEHRFVACIQRTGDTDVDVPVMVTLSYDAAEDPIAVRCSFEVDGGVAVWDFGRDLLSAGSRSLTPYGDGDVKFRYFPAVRTVLMCLRSPDGHADIALPVPDVWSFLNDTRKAAVEAQGTCEALVDDFLKELFEA